jgi:FAD:protein FMN transferase
VLCLLLAGCRATPRSRGIEPLRRSQPLLGTFVTVTIFTADREAGQHAINEAFAEFRQVDALMSIHRPESEISQVNAKAWHNPVVVSPQLFQVLAAGQEIARQTDGAFDMTVGPLVQLWGFLWKQYRLPTEAELKEVLPRVGYQQVELNPATRTVRFLREGISLDLGGIAKGYAVDRAIERLQQLGIDAAMVKAGGDLRVIGLPPEQSGWEVQLEDPRKQGKRTMLQLKPGALSTSGNYENYFVVNGHRYSHILDPRTGLPIQNIAACTLLASTCMASDAWATACVVLGAERSISQFGSRFPMQFTMVAEDGVTLTSQKTPDFPGLQTTSRSR